ncbi:0cf718e6-d724-4968-978f-47be74ebda45-CDS [Sclerotinia trifoliorum]|uniref:0cf718e6-d724-4968-978f-47be74ebda45-CDS n=1 Tax=Sclerotinia trifoliorum TaxID=28548 RepID=A0A8H2VU25_9HELO|nr:0cf718e6-d724-4968-978f-47be74ebda45-CDS [Sclerotinia trifoliorum]
MPTADAEGAFRTDNHAWSSAWKNDYAFQAGPSKAMNWYWARDTGFQKAAGLRASDADSMCGTTVMYDAVNGLILTARGPPSYQDSDATNNVHLIAIRSPEVAPTVETLKSTTYKICSRKYLWNPTTQTYAISPPHAIPTTYYSVACLTLDRRTFTGGGGSYGLSCAANHADAQIYSPAYLFTSNGTAAIHPVISSATSTVNIGGIVTIATDTAVTSFSITRHGSATHAVNTDQRRIALTPYIFTIPHDPGIALEG